MSDPTDDSIDQPHPLTENAQAPITAEAHDGLSKKAALAMAAIPIGRVRGVKAYVSVYHILLTVLLASILDFYHHVFSRSWLGRIALLVFVLCTACMYVVAGIIQCGVGRRFGAEPSSITVLPFFVLVSFKQLKLPRKGLVMTMMAWPLAFFALRIVWHIIFVFVSIVIIIFADDHCVDLLMDILLLEGMVSWYTLFMSLFLPIWPGPCFMAVCVLISKLGVPKRATLMSMGCVSIGLCAAGLVVGLIVHDFLLGLLMVKGVPFMAMLIINIVGLGRHFMSDPDGAAWPPFVFLKEKDSDPEEMEGKPLLPTSPPQGV
ncbi:hypothetical protein BSKO_10610 [Bryopsis sp. KO-2023]|nr:hypothetical protein BSKO_10610 [Bryopsis sp. KO-2023]